MANNGYKGRFRDRLRLIVINRYKKFKGIVNKKKEKVDNVKKIDNDKFIEERVNYIKKRISEEKKKLEVEGGIVNRKSGINESNTSKEKVMVNNKGVSSSGKNTIIEVNDSRIEKKSSSGINEDLSQKKDCDKEENKVKKNKVYVTKKNTNADIINNRNNKGKLQEVSSDKNVGKKIEKKRKPRTSLIVKEDVRDKEELKQELAVRIIKKIKSRLDDNLNELEVLESQLYFLNKDNSRELELAKVILIKKKIDEINKKIEKIRGQYEILKNNYYLEDVVEIDDKFLVDDIIKFRELVDSIDENREFVKEYKLLDEYRDLYEKLEEVSDIKERLVQENEEKIINYSDRDSNYVAICREVVEVDDIKKNVEEEIDRQNEYLNDLMKKVNKIDENEYVSYRFKGLGELIGSSLKYLGLMMMSPLAGFLPNIAVNTISAREMVRNIRKNMRLEEIKKVSYTAFNFNNEINRKLDDIDYIYYVIDDTISEVSRLKSDFLAQYNGNMIGYSDTLNKINELERMMGNNRKKVDIIRKYMLKGKKINKDKMIKVRKMNQDN